MAAIVKREAHGRILERAVATHWVVVLGKLHGTRRTAIAIQFPRHITHRFALNHRLLRLVIAGFGAYTDVAPQRIHRVHFVLDHVDDLAPQINVDEERLAVKRHKRYAVAAQEVNTLQEVLGRVARLLEGLAQQVIEQAVAIRVVAAVVIVEGRHETEPVARVCLEGRTRLSIQVEQFLRNTDNR